MVAGLGNPGEKYSKNRHNAGFMVLDALAKRLGAVFSKCDCPGLAAKVRLGRTPLILLKPQTYMNKSGLALAPLVDAQTSLIVVHDDLDLPFESIRIKERGGHGGQRGVKSIMEELGNGEFCRVKIGVGRPPEGISAAQWVLSDFCPDQEKVLEDMIERGVLAVLSILEEGPAAAMNKFNTSPKPPAVPAKEGPKE